MGAAACGPLVLAASSNTLRRIGTLAAFLCALGPVTAVALVMVGPAAYSRSSTSSSSGDGGSSSVALDAAAAAYESLGASLLAAATGWALYTGIAYELPLAQSWHESRARASCAVGVMLAVAAAATQAALCACTPYCLLTSRASA